MCKCTKKNINIVSKEEESTAEDEKLLDSLLQLVEAEIESDRKMREKQLHKIKR